MKKIFLCLIMMISLIGCGSKNNLSELHKSPEKLISGYVKAIVDKDKNTLKECIDPDNPMDDSIYDKIILVSKSINYTGYDNLKIKKISQNGNTSFYFYSGNLQCKDQSFPFAEAQVILNKDDQYYLMANNIDIEWAQEQLKIAQNDELFLEYQRQYQAFINDNNNREFIENLNRQTQNALNQAQQASQDAMNQAQQATQNALNQSQSSMMMP